LECLGPDDRSIAIIRSYDLILLRKVESNFVGSSKWGLGVNPVSDPNAGEKRLSANSVACQKAVGKDCQWLEGDPHP
jgi:hypothetical protein